MPDNWRDLQVQVATILAECGFSTQIEKDIETVRGTVNIDVFAEDSSQRPTAVYLCECKLWGSAIPKNVVHGFRTVVSDFGANWGFIISSNGFQVGAYEAAENSNIRLMNWQEFQDLFADRWVANHMLPQISAVADPLVEYTEPINSRIARKANALDAESLASFKALRNQYAGLAYFALILDFHAGHLELPLENAAREQGDINTATFPNDLLEATTLRDFMNIFIQHLATGTAAFDRVFGERA